MMTTGDRMLVNSPSFLSKTIRKVMLKYARQENLPTDYIFSHAGTIVIMNKRVRIVEAVANGLCPNKYYEKYTPSDDMIIVRPKVPYTEAEQDEITEYATDLIAINNFYQYWSLFCWLVYVYVTLKWGGKRYRLNLFGKGNPFSNVCYEATCLIMKRIRVVSYPGNPEHGTCFDIYNTDRDDIIYDNHTR